jgi:rod shape-determining protein MreC
VKITSAPPEPEVTANTSPSGLTPEEVIAQGTTTTSTTEPPVPTLPNGLPDTGTTLPGTNPDDPILDPVTSEPLTEEQLRVFFEGLAEAEAAAGSVPDDSVPDDSAPDGSVPDDSLPDTTTTTTIAPIIDKEYGALEGRGRLLYPQVRFLQDNPSLAELQVGDLVETAGGSESLAPPGIPVGRVANRADRAGSRGPLLDVDLHADLGRLNFVRVVLYKPLSEVGD